MLLGSFDDTLILLSRDGIGLLEFKISFKLLSYVPCSFDSFVLYLFFLLLFLRFGLILGSFVLSLGLFFITISLLFPFLIILACLFCLFHLFLRLLFLLFLCLRHNLFNFFSVRLHYILGVEILDSLKPDHFKWMYFKSKAQFVVTFINVFY